MVLAPPQVYLWTKDEYSKIAEMGVFDGKRVELIEGQVINMHPMGPLHITSVDLTALAFQQVFGANYFVRTQAPFDAGEISEPEPDLMVLQGHPRDYAGEHPTRAALIVEISDSSLAYDRLEKASLYAKAGVEDYWLVNITGRRLEVRRDPISDPMQPFGFGYRQTVIYTEADSVSPLAEPGVQIRVADLLP
jgi:Uma2 family endonuclease